MENLLSYLTWSNLATAVVFLLAVLSPYLGVKLRAIGKQLRELGEAYKKAISAESEMGAELSPAERRAIWNEVGDVLTALYVQYGKTWLGRLLGWNKQAEEAKKGKFRAD